MSKQKKNAVVEVTSLAASHPMTADQKVKVSFIQIIADADINAPAKSKMIQVLKTIPCGHHQPLHNTEIVQATGIDKASVKRLIRKMRIIGIPIASCNRGYYLCVNDFEVKQFTNTLAKRIETAARVIISFQSYTEADK